MKRCTCRYHRGRRHTEATCEVHGDDPMIAREEQMTTPIDPDVRLKFISTVTLATNPDLNRLIELNDKMWSKEGASLAEADEFDALYQSLDSRLHATTAAPPDVREAIHAAITDCLKRMERTADITQQTPGIMVAAYHLTNAVLAALPSAPVPTDTVTISRSTAETCIGLIEAQRMFLGSRRAVPAIEEASLDLDAALTGDQQGEVCPECGAVQRTVPSKMTYHKPGCMASFKRHLAFDDDEDGQP